MKHEHVKCDVKINRTMSDKCGEIMLTGHATSAFRGDTSHFRAATLEFGKTTSDDTSSRGRAKKSHVALSALVAMTWTLGGSHMAHF